MHETRRHFLSMVAALSGSALLLGACDDDMPMSSGGTDAGAASARCKAMIGGNHGHELAVTRDDATAGAAAAEPTTLHIQGTSSHDHTITLTPLDFQMLLAGESVAVTSTATQAHTHSVTLSC